MHRTWIALLLLGACSAGGTLPPPEPGGGRDARPNVILVVADDLGYGELGCYGQQKIHTPHLDALAAAGMRFTDFYSGAPVCAPARCTLFTGLHSGHAFVRDNREVQPEGQLPLPADTVTLGKVLQRGGYKTGLFGKWGLGGPGSSGAPRRQGFDRFYGFLCQRKAHEHYPKELWSDEERVPLDGTQYAQDLCFAQAREFVAAHQDRPFFAAITTTVPHMAMQVPEDSLAEYRDRFEDAPYDGTQGYRPHPTPHAAYAGMVSRLDREIGALLRQVQDLGMQRRTIVLFTSDNGPTHDRVGGADSAFFASTAGLRGLKGSVHEGGIRVPLLAWGPGRVPAGRVSGHVGAFQDLMPTVLDLCGVGEAVRTDGISFAGTLQGSPVQAQHEALFWEFPGYGGQLALRMRNWKGVRKGLDRDPRARLELYDLATDPAEQHDLAAREPLIVAEIDQRMRAAHTPSREFPCDTLDPPLVAPSARQLRWHQLGFYAFVHFGMNTFTDREWGTGKEEPQLFLPSQLDCRQWARIAKEAGMKGIILTAKHHDGFCLWPTRTTTHSVASSNWKGGNGDVVRELAAACREQGLGLGIYLSPWDRNASVYGQGKAYDDFYLAQLLELLTGYGEIFEVWQDGACAEGPNGKKQVHDWKRYWQAVRELQPHAVIFSDVGPDVRWIGNEDGLARSTNWSTLTPEGTPGRVAVERLGSGDPEGSTWLPAECDVSIRPSWFHRQEEDSQVKSLAELFAIWEQSVGMNAALLLNLPVDRRGLVPDPDAARLRELRQTLDAVYGTPLGAGTAARPLVAELPERTLGNRVVLREQIEHGQRVAAFVVEALVGGRWEEIGRGTTVGSCRIVATRPVETTRVRVRVLESRRLPRLLPITVHRAPPTLAAQCESPLFLGETSVELVCDWPGAAIHYTLDGSEPDARSPRCTGPIRISASTLVRAIAIAGDQRSLAEARLQLTRTELLPALVFVREPDPGLVCKRYEIAVESLDSLPRQQATDERLVTTIDLEVRPRDEHFALEFTGLVLAPADGIYTFELESDDGSRLWVGDQLVVDGDRRQGLRRTAGQIALAAGYHPLRVAYRQGDGERRLRLTWHRPGGTPAPIPAAALRH